MAKHRSNRGARSRAVALSTAIALLFGLGFAAVGTASATEAPAGTIVTSEPVTTDAPAPAATEAPVTEAPEGVETSSEPSAAPSAEPTAEPSTEPSTEPSAELTEPATEAPNPAARAAGEHAAPAEGTAAIYGRLIDSVTKEPLVGFSVELARYNGEDDSKARQKSATDDTGAFAFIVTEATWYGVEASNDARGYVRAYSDDIDAVLGENFDVADIEIVRGAIISGTLTPPAGLASGFTTSVSAVPVSGNTGYGYAPVELTPGTPTLWHLAVLPGTYNVQLSAAYNATTALWWNSAGNVATQGASQSITVAVGDSVPGVDGTLSYSDRLIRGTVFDDQGVPLVNVSVQARPAAGFGNYLYGYTDDQGEYVIGNLAGGNYILQFIPRPGDGMSEFYDNAATRDLATPLAFVAGTARTYDNIDATIAPGYSISGTVTMPSIPNTYANVVAESANGTVSDNSSWNSADSSYIIQNLAPGEYTLKFTVGSVVQYYGGDTKAEATVLTVPDGETTDLVGIDVSIAVAMISGTIATAPGSYPQVEILSLDGAEVVGTGYTGSGTYSVAVAPGSYKARVVENNTISQYYNGVFTLEEATPIVVADGDTFAADFGLVGGTISGTVTADASVFGAVATLYRANDTLNSVRTVTLDDSGAYTFDGLTPNNYVIKVASGSTLLTERWFGPSGKKADATAIDLKANAHHTGADIVLTEGGGLRGTITGLTNSGSANIYLYTADYSWVTSVYAYASDGSDERTWSLAGVPAGEYKIQLSSSGTTEWWNNATSFETATLITVSAGGWVESIDFAPGVSIGGTVTSSADGSLVTYGSVQAYGSGEVNPSHYANIASDGRYAFTDLPDGDYKLKFDGNSNTQQLKTQWYSNATDLDSATAITVVDGVSATSVDVALQPGIAISGTVTDAATGAPITNASISGWSSYSIVTDANGHYSSTVAAAGRYQFSVRSSTHVNPSDVVFDVPAEGLSNADVHLVAGTVISGTVTAANNGVPLSNVSVYISSTSENWWSNNNAYTDYNGNFTSQPLLPGTYYVRYENSQGQYVTQWFDNAATGTQSTAVDVGIDPVTDIDAQLTLGGAIVGTITGSDGKPIANARVGLATAPTQAAARTSGARVAGGELLGIETYTGSDGSYRLPTVEPGRYVLFVYENDHKTSWYNGQSTLDKATVIVVEAGKNIEVDAAVEPLAENETALQPEQTLSTAFAVTQQPADQSVESGFNAAFTAFASGDPLPTVQWQSDETGEWADLFWQTSTTLNVTAPAVGDLAVNYRAVFTQNDETRTSIEASLTVLEPITAPDAPIGPMISGQNFTGGTVTWMNPPANGAPITSYTIKVYEVGGTTPVRTVPTGVVYTSAIGSLKVGTEYEVTVTATNSQGDSPESERSVLQTLAFTAPDAPASVTVVAVDSTNLTASWPAPSSDGGTAVTQYLVGVYQGSDLISFQETDARTVDISNLVRGTAYTVDVIAQNDVGNSPSIRSDAASTLATVPDAGDAPTLTQASASEINVTWTAPNNGGSSLTAYSVQLFNGNTLVATKTTDAMTDLNQVTFTGLARGVAYTAAVTATNHIGTGPASALSDALTIPATVPGAPDAPTLLAHSATAIAVAWSAPIDNGGSPLTGFTVTLYQGSERVSSQTTDARSLTFSGLTRATAYTAVMVANNAVGSSAVSDRSAAVSTPATSPGAPRMLSIHDVTSPTAITVTWLSPLDDGGRTITGYTLKLYQGDDLVATEPADVSDISHTFTGLTRATEYTFEVSATNAVGTGPASARSAVATTLATVPDAAAAPTLAQASVSSLDVTWAAPNNGGSAITGYTARLYDGASMLEEKKSETTTTTFTGLTRGIAYTVVVFASNAIGMSTESPKSAVLTIPVTVPGVPDAPTLTTSSATSAVVTWSAPIDDGGAAITGYRVNLYQGAELKKTSTTDAGTLTATFTGLTRATAYTAEVVALNGIATGSMSERSDAVSTPATAPGVPAAPTLTAPSATTVAVDWVAPVDGGSPITGYRVKLYQGTDLVRESTTTDALTITFTGLTRATAFTADVVATTVIGSSAVSDRSTAVSTPATSPGAPTGLNIGATSSSQVAVTWQAPADDGGSAITGYTLKLYQGTELVDTQTARAIDAGHTFTGLTRATAYTFEVSATNSVGTGHASARSAATTTLATVPDAAAAPTLAQASVSIIDVTWVAPNNGGSEITGYTVSIFNGSTLVETKTTDATTVRFDGLTRGIGYTATVVATNLIGTGSTSASSAAVTIPLAVPGVPDAPTITVSSATEIAVAWTKPVDDGGSAITGYRVNLYQGHTVVKTATTDAFTVAFTGLTRATAYTAEVIALNAIGGTAASARSASATTPATVPGTTTAPALAADSATTVTASWSATADNGGSAVTGYTVLLYSGSELVAEQTTDAATTTAAFTGLDDATDYTATVRSANDVGTSANSAVSGTVRTAPADPIETDLTAETQDQIVPSSIDLIQGDSVTISGLTPGERYFAFFLSTPIGTSWQTASSTGTITVKVPTSFTTTAHRIVVTNAAGVIVGWANVTIQPVPTSTGTPAAPAGTAASTAAEKKALAGTGTDPLPFGLLAGLVFALGAALLTAGRRRGRAGRAGLAS